jgi:hypothetical protein
MGEAFKKKLTVTETRELVSWPNPKSKTETVLYEVKAVDENGKTWEPHPLRSFAILEIGVQFEYDCEPYEHAKSGEKSITLKRPRQNTTQRVAHLEGQLEDLTDRLAAVEARLAEMPSKADALPLGPPIPGQRPPGLGGRVE